MKKKINTRVLTKVKASLVSMASVFLLVFLVACSNTPGESNLETLEPASLVRVVDGDTIIVNVGGAVERVRLIGIDAPECVSQDTSLNTLEGEEARDFLMSLVMVGQTVYLQRDINNRDQFDRLLRYVWLEEPEDLSDIDEVRRKMLNGILVDSGNAQSRRYPPDTAYSDIFEMIEEGGNF
jgi:micrococcal nuclease